MSQLMLMNPRRRRRKTARKNPASNPRRRTRRRAVRRNPVAANPRRRRRRSYRRRNPRFSIRSINRDVVTPAVMGGVGALGIDVAFGMLPIPSNFKTGMMGSLTKIAGAIVLGNFVGKFAGKKFGEAFTVGAATIQAYGLIKNFAQQALPNVPMGEYLSATSFDPYALPYGGGMGYVNAAPVMTGGAIAPYSDGQSSGVGEYLSDYSSDSYGGGYAY